ncbi:hypothetical protein BAUCODRAFT_77741 [Baudoinia panamericana UAMH 10762]|uniref:Major facilitator superfamily (MFS) profile domain-containing protein n=1 Tax=Baudoinia panamericana (strain UAMH 10762) TaxID=717646 RepID=M2N0N9_BAUPA|nr:uncharacterized protein BAUCODRAFT_77741 [Baudoinia panamericana UAMH 10762]EMC92190.1 hypothetical protein BAUCODRAFT_77741 [Baudoinia panamericana UAMH 10762]
MSDGHGQSPPTSPVNNPLRRLDEYDAGKQIELEKTTVSQDTSSTPSRCPSPQRDGGKTMVSFEDGDVENPYNFSQIKKLYIVITAIMLVMNSTIGSSVPSGSAAATLNHFHINNREDLVLPNSIYLVGYVLGPLAFSPLSETYGRKIVMIATFAIFTAFTLGCALTPTFAGLIVMRFLVGIGASTPVSVVGGIYADIYNTRKARGLVITLFMAATTWGPLIGPIASGYTAHISWRWSYWILLIIAGATWPLLIFMPETYGPVILKRKAQRMRKATGDETIVAPVELEKVDVRELIVVILTRPIRMFLFEAIVFCSCLYLAVAYGIFFMYFQAYPIIFEGIYGFSAGEEGLAFIPIGVGAAIASIVYLAWDGYLDRAQSRTSPPAWSQIEEYVRLPLACLGGPLFVASLFWLGWTAKPSIHWIVPTMSALPFGLGFLLVFMGQLNYIVDAYEVFAASATGAAACTRAVFGVVLPFAAAPMYDRLGVAWACSTLAFLSLLMSLIPFVFIRFGDRIRANSKFCQELKRKKEASEAETARRRESQAAVRQPVEDPEKQV